VTLAHRALAFMLRLRHAALLEIPALADAEQWRRLVVDVRSYGVLPAPVLEALSLIEAELCERDKIRARAARVVG
jgi:hypothetical protein